MRKINMNTVVPMRTAVLGLVTYACFVILLLGLMGAILHSPITNAADTPPTAAEDITWPVTNKEPAVYAGYEFGGDIVDTINDLKDKYDQSSAMLDEAVGTSEYRTEKAYLYTGAWSIHVKGKSNFDYNEVHDMVGFTYANVTFVNFSNSYGNDSYALAYHWHRQWKDLQYGAQLGVVKGYDDGQLDFAPCSGDYCLGIVPQVTYTKFALQPSLMLLGRAVVFSFRWEI